MTDRKHVLGSPEWIACAGRILKELVAEFGETGQSFSGCEILVGGPKEIADADGCACWSITVDGKNLRFHPGRADDTELVLQATWELELTGARTVYTPEYLAEQERSPTPRPEDPNLALQGDLSKLPAWMLEFHNRMAVVTA